MDNIKKLSPADFFSLIGLIRKSLSHKKGGYIDPLKVYPRFLKPSKELMENHLGLLIDGKLTSAVSIFPTFYKTDEKELALAEIEYWGETDISEEKSKLLKKAEDIATSKGIEYIYSFEQFENFLPKEEKYINLERAIICDNENIDEVFAFMHPRVLTKHDFTELKKLYTSASHEIFDDNEFVLGISSGDCEPIVIKNSSGKVVGLFINESQNKIRKVLVADKTFLIPILKAYFIFYQQEELKLEFNENTKDLSNKNSTEIKYFYKKIV